MPESRLAALPPGASPVLARAGARAAALAARARAPNTRRAYASAWRAFACWCAAAGLPVEADPVTVALHLADLSGRLKYATIRLRLSAIAAQARSRGLILDRKDAVLAAVIEGIARERGTPPRRVDPLVAEELRHLVSAMGEDVRSIRDRALLLVGFAGALRRSELVALDRRDIVITRRAAHVQLRRSKTDAHGQGEMVRILRTSPPCPVSALEDWFVVLPNDGPVFRAISKAGRILARRLCDKTVARLVKRAVERAGLDPRRYAGHSLRAGLATSAHAQGKSLFRIGRHTRHRSLTELAKYIRESPLAAHVTAELFRPLEDH